MKDNRALRDLRVTKKKVDIKKPDKETYVMKYNVHVYTFCYNEEKVIPFAVDYWKRFATKVIVYDNFSTDRSVEMLSKYDFVEIRKFIYPNGIDDFQLKNMKNNIWKESRYVADYVVVCDMDEFLYTKDFETLFDFMHDNDINIVKPYGIQLVSYSYPTYKTGKLMHEIVDYGSYDKRFSKCVLFNPNKVDEINYDFGCHYCYSDTKKTDIRNLFLFHSKYVGSTEFIGKMNDANSRLSEKNKVNKYGVEYTYTDDAKNKMFFDLLGKSHEILSLTNKERYYLVGDYTYDRRLCLVVVPIYRDLTPDDRFSLDRLIDVLGRDHDICIMHPNKLDITNIKSEFGHVNFIELSLPDYYFDGKNRYSELLLTSKFYNTFDAFKYILIYQLDALVFYNALDYFCYLDYDYIGAPHMVEDLTKGTKEKAYSVGNGGLSLRKVSKMSEICKDIVYDGVSFEDVVISYNNRDRLNLPSNDIGFSFSIQEEKEKNVEKLGHLPFGCHYYKWDSFWEKFINDYKDI